MELLIDEALWNIEEGECGLENASTMFRFWFKILKEYEEYEKNAS